eukprot:8136450-Alexandrium_andersonii.AAC.1
MASSAFASRSEVCRRATSPPQTSSSWTLAGSSLGVSSDGWRTSPRCSVIGTTTPAGRRGCLLYTSDAADDM